MPLQRSSTPTPVPLLRGAVLFDADPRLSVRCYHAAIVAAGNDALTLEIGKPISVHEMDRELRFGTKKREQQPVVTEHTYLGSLSGPDSTEKMLRVLRVISRLAHTLVPRRAKRARYSLGSPSLVPLPAVDGQPTSWEGRFSCVSFVEWCYTEAGQDLVDDDRLPKLDGEQIAWLFEFSDRPPLTKKTEIETFLAKRGLEPTQGPWPILLPGYQMRAFFEERLPHIANLERDRVVNLERWERERRERSVVGDAT